MRGAKSFIIGFIVSFSVVGIAEKAQPSIAAQRTFSPAKIDIPLYKTSNSPYLTNTHLNLFSKINKTSILKSDNSTSIANNNLLDGIDDEEILSVNINDELPIDYSYTISDRVEPSTNDINNEEKVAMLPSADGEIDSPWITAKSSSNIKNKKLLEEISAKEDTDIFSLKKQAHIDTSNSYMVAEKIKQSLIFPIPDEILNDENLTPTFISPRNNKPTKKAVKETDDNLSVKKAVTPEVQTSNTNETSSKGILDSISDWFKSPQEGKETPTPKVTQKKKKAPSYSSVATSDDETLSIDSTNNKVNKDNILSIYNDMQSAKANHQKQQIIPNELKLLFQPNKAEISGSALTWIKKFSQSIQNNNKMLLIQISDQTPTEIQKKRLNLLYTILINNNVDEDKVKLTFKNIDINTFYIKRINDE